MSVAGWLINRMEAALGGLGTEDIRLCHLYKYEVGRCCPEDRITIVCQGEEAARGGGVGGTVR